MDCLPPEAAQEASRRSAGAESVVKVLGLPLAPLSFLETLDEVERLINQAEPAFFITANTHYAMLSASEPALQAVNAEAAFLVADGMPLVWAARLLGRRLPERVAGADLVPALCARAADRGFRVFLLGAAPGVALEAADRLQARDPALNIVGVEFPRIDELAAEQHEELAERIRESQADLLFAALGQPKGELWLARHYREFGRAVCVQVGASLDFAAGNVCRAPRWMQKTGLEWGHRLYRDPRRLLTRYARNAAFLAATTLRGGIRRALAVVGESSRAWRLSSENGSPEGTEGRMS